MYIVIINKDYMRNGDVSLCYSMEDVKDSFDHWYENNHNDEDKLMRENNCGFVYDDVVFEGKDDWEIYTMGYSYDNDNTFEYKKIDVEELKKEKHINIL